MIVVCRPCFIKKIYKLSIEFIDFTKYQSTSYLETVIYCGYFGTLENEKYVNTSDFVLE